MGTLTGERAFAERGSRAVGPGVLVWTSCCAGAAVAAVSASPAEATVRGKAFSCAVPPCAGGASVVKLYHVTKLEPLQTRVDLTTCSMLQACKKYEVDDDDPADP